MKHNSFFNLMMLCFCILGINSCNGQKTKEMKTASKMALPTVTAPEINTEYGWLNTGGKSYKLADFKGKFVLLDFWTFGCINCQHIIPDLRKLETEFADRLVVVGVHSAKFDSEKNTANIRKATLKFGIEHPVVNDADFKVWQQYAVRAWPTVVLISPDGKVIGQRSGENIYGLVKDYITELSPAYEAQLNKQPIAFQKEKMEEMQGLLSFPSKIIADDEGNFWLANSGKHQVIKINPEGKVLETIGAGSSGDAKGSYSEAKFYEPHGLAYNKGKLYIADTKNNKIKVADLSTKQVRDLCGDGSMGYYYMGDDWDTPVNPNSPWDLLIKGEQMFVANAGNHQILRVDLNSGNAYRFAGNGREALEDGTYRECSFNQPSGLLLADNELYIADAEASAVRRLSFSKGKVGTLFGKGLFDFGDKDGDFSTALLQHCVGLEYYQGKFLVADTYNGKVKWIDPKTSRITTLASGFEEPNDLLIVGDLLYVTGTNNHKLFKINLKTNEKTEIEVKL